MKLSGKVAVVTGASSGKGPIGDVTDEKYEQIMKVNIYGPMATMRTAVNLFINQGRKGCIINVASVGGMRTCAGAVYYDSKAEVISLDRNTVYMYMPDGIRCNAIDPGGINTEISHSMGVPNMVGCNWVRKVPGCAPELGSAEDIVHVALFLASDEASYINGVVLPVGSGWATG